MKTSKLIALSAIVAGMSVVLLFLGSVTQVLDLTMAAFASILITIAIIEIKGKYPLLIYAVTSILSIILLPEKTGALVYILFAGYYPIVRRIIEEKFPVVVSWFIKLLIFNAALSLVIAGSVIMLGLADTEVGLNILIYILGNVTFVVFDFALTTLITFYLYRLQRRLNIKKLLK